MDLKAFKGLPHEFGGIDYTEGSEVEGGEFAVNIGKSGNEYIFDKNSSEGKKLSKEFKRLDINGRLSEDDPLSLETFDQIAKEEALKHAQRSVNEKGIDPFRNMYDEGGQAANGGVKYYNGGAKDMYFGGGVMAFMPGGMIDTGTRNEGLLMKDKISEVTNLGNGGVNKYATGGYNPRAMGTDPYDNYMMDPLQMRNQPVSSEISGGYELFQDNGSSFINNLTGSTTNNSINLSPQDNLSYNNPNSSPAPQQRLAMEPIPTIDAYQLPTQSYGEMPTADKSYDVSSADISGGAGGAAGGAAGGGSPMGMITKGLGMASDAITAIQGPQYKGGSDSIIAEKGSTRQKSVAPKYGYSTSGEMMGEAMKGMSKGAEMGSMAGPIGGAIGAAAGMIIAPMMKGMKEEKANKALQFQFKNQLMQKNAEERRDEQWDAISKDVDFNGKIDKDRYAGLIGLGSTQNKFAKQGGALPKNKGIYGYYANGGGVGDPANGGNYNIDPSLGAQLEQIRYERGVDTLGSGITYQDLQGGRSHPVYDEAGNEMSGVRNIGASSMSPGFDIRTNTYQPPVRTNTPQSRFGTGPQINNTMRRQELSAQPVRQSAPQQYSFQAQDPCADNGLNQGFNLYNEPRKYAQKGNYYNPESLQKNEFVGPPEMSITDPLNPNFVGPPEDLGSTLTNNETGQSYKFQNGGGKKANSNNAYEDYLIAKKKELAFKAATEGPYGINYSDVMYGPSQIEGRTDMRTEINNGNVNQSFNQVSENRNIGASSLSPGFDVRIETDALNGQANQKFFTRNNAIGDISTNINGITQFQNGGGKKKEEVKSYDGMKDPVQWDIMQNYIASNDTRDRMSQAAVGSGDEMYAPYRVDNTCVAGVNCFEDLAGIPSSEGIPDDIYNNRLLKDFFESEEGQKYFKKVKNEKPGDYVQYENTLDPRGINYPFHLGMVTGNNKYLGDGSSDNPLYYSTINKQPSIQTAGLEFNNINPNFYRMLDKKNRKKVIDAALQAKQQGKDVIRPTLGQEATGYLPLQQYRKNTSYPIAGF
jgi:hypothetical protein